MFFLHQNPIDIHLAKRLRFIRTTCNVTLNELGELVGVSYQQIHKYETGINKISASRLYEICRVLNKPITSFFENIEADPDYYNFDFPSEEDVWEEDQEKNKELINLVRVFNKIEDEETRISIINMIDTFVKTNNKSYK